MGKDKAAEPRITDPSLAEKISPSQFMRELRPEYYSDTTDRVAYALETTTLEYHLDTITERNQTQAFEVFCRKLCERTICPNLRPHTGPDGGGDSKVDTETYPISEETASLFYVGKTNSAREKWAFAFSAKKTWSSKVRDDVKGIIETDRGYKRIIFVTSRFARDKDRARVEDELTKQYGIPVTIHDRSWIVKEIIENDRKDIAYNFLKVGETRNAPLRLGPTDYSRTQQLEEIEKSIDDLDAYVGMELQRVTEALVAAKLSRNLEQSRSDIDGRFLRAIRLANKDGTFRQQLDAKYEHIWTAFWWFDDIQFLMDSYEPFEKIALESNRAVNLELLCNLLQLFINSIVHGHITPEESKLDERLEKLKLALECIIENKDQPNNSLEAKASLLILQMNQIFIDGNHDKLPDVWRGFAETLEKASGLGEFNADRFVEMIEVAGAIAGNDPVYNDLVDKVAKFVSNRKSEAEGAIVLLNRARKLDFSEPLEIIRLSGKATIGLSKKEYTDQLIEALELLTLAYRRAGLLWAARAGCISLATSLVVESEEDSILSASFVPTMKIFAWIALELHHLPDFLFAIQMLNSALATLPLTEDSRDKVNEDLRELDLALGSQLLNLNAKELEQLECLPDVLEALGLFMARSSLLYIFGYMDTLRTEGYLPKEETDEGAHRIFSMLASQPVGQNQQGSIILNTEDIQTFKTAIIGMTVEISSKGSFQAILATEAILGSLEAFFATTIEQRISPHTEKISINLIVSNEVSKPSLQLKAADMTVEINWPRALSPTNFKQQKEVLSFLAEVSGTVLAATCYVEKIDMLLDKLYVDEAVQHRVAIAAYVSTSYNRLASKNTSRISDWQELVKKTYKTRAERPTLTIIDLNKLIDPDSTEKKDDREISNEIKDHRTVSVRSVINVPAWDQALWKGTGFVQSDPIQPPHFAFLFEDKAGAEKIFKGWLERFGKHDENDEISLSIVRQLPLQNKHHYYVFVSSKLLDTDDPDFGKRIAFSSRYMMMAPDNDINLERFLDSFHRVGAFYLLPAIINKNGPPEFLDDLAILKHKLFVKLAKDVGKNDVETIVLRGT
ncbi:hypothetical protein [uncultured Sneathiella sp.]|uniref:hypothetical protein n=1 Tax=uncultured Sneathiella sp. TaxID=879315 RepID=UPI0030D751CB